MTAAVAPEITIYAGRVMLGAIRHAAHCRYDLVGPTGRKIDNAPSLATAVAAICDAAKAAPLTFARRPAKNRS